MKALRNCEKEYIAAMNLMESFEQNENLYMDLCKPIVDIVGVSPNICRAVSSDILYEIYIKHPNSKVLFIRKRTSTLTRFSLNSEFEKWYLKDIKKQTENMSDAEKESAYYLAIVNIALNGYLTNIPVDSELQALRREFYETCEKKLNLAIEGTLGEAENIIRGELNIPIGIFFLPGLNNFKISLVVKPRQFNVEDLIYDFDENCLAEESEDKFDNLESDFNENTSLSSLTDEERLDVLIKHADFVAEELKKCGKYSDEAMYSYYKRIAEYAKFARKRLFDSLSDEDKVIVAIWGDKASENIPGSIEIKNDYLDDQFGSLYRLREIYEYYRRKVNDISGVSNASYDFDSFI